MYPSTKVDVDKHVEECLKKINNESERNLRCFSFAKQYFKIERYEEARRYVLSYLSVKPNSAEGHYLLGRTLEMLGKKEAAYQAYATSLKLDPKQNNLIIKVCELLASDDVQLDTSGAKFFCDMAQSFDPHSSAVFNLKQRLVAEQNDDPRDITALLLKELEYRPTDVKLRVRLLKHLLQYNMIKEAYKHVVDIESKNLEIFYNCSNWYEVVAEILLKYQRNTAITTNLGWEYWFMIVSVFDRLASLSLDEHLGSIKSNTDYIATVFNFDQTLQTASQNISDCPDKQLAQEFLNHYRGQLCLHLLTLIFKQANKYIFSNKEAFYMALPTLFVAYHCQPPDLQGLWVSHLEEHKRHLVQKWSKEASFRCSQAGHILFDAAKDRKAVIIEKTTQYSAGLWKEQLFKKLFITRDHQMKMTTSFFLTDQQLVNVTIRLPEREDLEKYDLEAQLLHPDSLHHHVWIALNNKLTRYKCSTFEGLPYSIKNLKNCGAETINFLDIQAFIYATTFCAQINIENTKNLPHYNFDKPNVLPAAVTYDLSTLEQSKFFRTAYKIYKNEYDSGLDALRSVLIDGIKIIRCVDHVLDIKLLVILATTFAKQAKKLTKQSEIDFNEARAALYWKAAIPFLEKMKANLRVTVGPNKFFIVKSSKSMPWSEVCSNLETGKLFQAMQLMKKKEYEKSLRILENLRDPYASFYQAQIYKCMADEQIGQHKENVTSEMRSQNIILMSRARDCLYLTLDRLREPSVDQKHPLNTHLGSEIEKMENLLSRIDPDCTNRNECDGMSDGNVSSNDSAEELFVSRYNVTHDLTTRSMNHQSTPYRLDSLRREAKPSPERLDAQIRQLAASKDATLTHILEQNKLMADSHRSFVDELRSFKEAVNNLTSTVEDLKCVKQGYEELKDIKTCMSDLKNSINELDNFKTITDMVYEMKKEISELKKDLNKTTQLSDEDIYGLTGDYGSDYNINSNLAAYNTNLYQNCQGRVSSSTSLYPSPLYPLYPAIPYYGGLGLPHVPGTLPLNPEQQLPSDFRTAQPGLLPPPSVSVSYSQTVLPTASSLPSNILGPQNTVPPNSMLFKESKPSPIGVSTLPLSIPSSSTSIPSAISNKPPAPVNVVITTSDPLPPPQSKSTRPILSVNIPVEHLKGNVSKPQPHNYQIPLPTTIANPSPSILNKPPPAVSTQSLLLNVAPPVYSAVKDAARPNALLGLPDQSGTKDTSLDKSNISSSSIEELDPCPDFKPIIPLPDEVPVTTGEENETVLFCAHAKLFRYVITENNKEWKERGIGNIKILKNPQTGKIRILMRRDQVHKICANHFLTKDMTLTPKTDKGYIWAAHDFADEEVVVEKLCARFKTPEEAKRFYDAFEGAKKNLPANDNKAQQSATSASTQPSLGGFVFTTPPSFKPKSDFTARVEEVQSTANTVKSTSPFSNFVFGAKQTASVPPFGALATDPKSGPSLLPAASALVKNVTSPKPTDEEDEFVPTAEFKPVVPLPELVEVKTGEENSEVLFESRAKLLRFIGESKEWKERGIGIMKILKDNIVRLVMRRDQIHKVCCNHQLFKDIQFSKMPNNAQAVTWCAKDFSEGVLKNETFAIRFKTEELATKFVETIKSAQASLDDNNNVAAKQSEKQEVMSPIKPTGFGDKFKPVTGSWECKNCYIVNQAKMNYCAACETPRSGTTPDVMSPIKPTGFGDKFKPVKGSWECKNCYIVNQAKMNYCAACETPRSGTTPKKEDSSSGAAFSFGVTTSNTGFTSTTSSSWGNKFKPKEGSWECTSCYVRNNGDVTVCASCSTPKDGTQPQQDGGQPVKPQPQGVNLDTGGLKFSFGIPTATTTPTPKSIWTEQTQQPKSIFNVKPNESSDNIGLQKFTFGLPTTETAAKATFTFGQTTITPLGPKPKPIENQTSSGLFNFSTTTTPSITKKENEATAPAKFVFGSPQKHDFEFTHTPRSPRQSTGPKDEESEGSFLEEEDNIYFKPVIPLPDKIEVKTGEEDEEVLYCHRAKLFRFAGGEWRERGLGDIKILKQKATGKLRVLMRRDQVFKICLNHILTPDIKYVLKDDKSWLFCAPDFSEGVVSNEQLCVRFKTAEIAEDFKKAIDKALNNDDSGAIGVSDKSSTTSDESDIVLISETKVTPEEEQEAIKLGLPPKFMSYRQLQDCSCAQCKKDDEYLSSNQSNVTKTDILKINQQKSKPASTPQGSSGSETLKSLLSKPILIPPKFSPQTFTSSSPISTAVTTTTVPASNLFTFKSNLSQTPESQSSSALNTFSFVAPPTTTGAFPTTTKSIFYSPEISESSFLTPTTNTFSTSSIFGSSNSSVFGSVDSKTASSDSNTSIFKSPLLFESKPQSTTGTTVSGSIFGTSTSFEKLPAEKSIFGGTSQFGGVATKSIFGATVPQFAETNTTLKETDAPVLDSKDEISFANLAARVSADPKLDIKKDESKDKTSPFAFLGAGAPVFASLADKNKTDKNKSVADNSEENVAGADEEYDPHYEPIVPLPDAIVVSTGEEDETIVFNERAKLFRYDSDSKAWKERGVGQMKILHHPANNTYRFLLRREQVHKVVLNQLLVPELELQPMTSSDRAWMWAGYNYFEDGSALEKLAIRFKNCELAQQFHDIVKDVMEKIKNKRLDDSSTAANQSVENTPETPSLIPATIQNYEFGANKEIEVTAEDDYRDESDDDDDDDDEDDDEDEPELITGQLEEVSHGDDDEDDDDRSIMFTKHCTLSEEVSGNWNIVAEGELQVYYDPDYYATRICISNLNNELVSNTVIGINTVMKVEGNSCVWSGVEWCEGQFHKRKLKATFNTTEEAEEFHCTYLEGLSYAQECDTEDVIPEEEEH